MTFRKSIKKDDLTIFCVEKIVNDLYKRLFRFMRLNRKLTKELLLMKANEMIDKIEEIRKSNNESWMAYVRLIMKYSPKEGMELLNRIADNDIKIADFLEDRQEKLLEETRKSNNELWLGLVRLANRIAPKESKLIQSSIVINQIKIAKVIKKYDEEQKILEEESLND